MNELPDDPALSDRITPIYLPGYEHKEKICILRDYLLPRALQNAKMGKRSVTLDEVTENIVERVSPPGESGVRSLEKAINGVVNKVAFLKNHQNTRGKLTGFNVSFDPKKKLRFPLKLDREIIDKLL